MDKTDHFLFFTDDLTADRFELNETETRHAVGVLRLQRGDTLQITDGKGTRAIAVLDTVASNRRGACTVLSRQNIGRTAPFITLCVGLPERNAFESILADITALGIVTIVPIAADYCQKRWWESDWEKLAVRFRSIMVTALKQSQGFHLPRLSNPCSLEAALSVCSGSTAIVADQAGSILHDVFKPERTLETIACFIGPPGGFSEHEHVLLRQWCIPAVQIARHRLRTELAAVVVCAQIGGWGFPSK